MRLSLRRRRSRRSAQIHTCINFAPPACGEQSSAFRTQHNTSTENILNSLFRRTIFVAVFPPTGPLAIQRRPRVDLHRRRPGSHVQELLEIDSALGDVAVDGDRLDGRADAQAMHLHHRVGTGCVAQPYATLAPFLGLDLAGVWYYCACVQAKGLQ